MQLHPAAASAWYDLIIDGQLMQDNLRAAGRDERWLDARLHAEGIGQRSEVFYAACDKGDGFFRLPREINKSDPTEISVGSLWWRIPGSNR